MGKNTMAMIALIITIAYGGLFAVVPAESRTMYAVIGAVVVAAAWVVTGMSANNRRELE